jgi:cytidyltransferase-like protein
MTTNQAIKRINSWQQSGKSVVLTTGVFDLLHIEHIRFLTKAKLAGDKLIVGIENDKRVRDIKGVERPVNNHRIRIEQLEALKVVDTAFLLPTQFSSQTDWEQFMRNLHPDTYAVSSHTSYLENKLNICQKFNIDFRIVHQFNPDYSTTNLHQKLLAEL